MMNNALFIKMLKDKMHQDIPLTQHMGVEVDSYQLGKLVLSAPLESNINHRHTAFGGSVASLATLSCWGLIFLELNRLNYPAGVVIQRGNTEYLKPIDSDFKSECQLTNQAEFDRFVRMLERKGLARMELSANITCRNNLAATFSGAFVARRAD
jgi:thioesterase domain-containing protein